jgi:hypothetical protein
VRLPVPLRARGRRGSGVKGWPQARRAAIAAAMPEGWPGSLARRFDRRQRPRHGARLG